ncbi:YggS family pyridoxal phosphate-dependent enzyme [Pelagicoccus sp. SDUM812002]|uniref:YggS family pyridoxal phosphate-dependent enzyme n=1 Tax=Pelagicoccus sp. SDUM812002 TaxID=3041266 RepID=UPI00280C9875|nr:YggS family pyridoxal phosphate-dependent enzyme [Pelagicoccus sp. SDUM812002]MDQ8186456.1 YggS family pyridoxal phosphate-dependent enzyme [Pelagicoccus sp. SDUM812002]
MLISFEDFQANLAQVMGQIAAACRKVGRKPESVTLLPVTKNHPVDVARYAWEAGLRSVGENRVQEALGKMGDVDVQLRWELIGPLQSNKSKKVAESFARVQTVDRVKIAKALDRYAGEAGRTLSVLLQVNAGRDPAKSGVELEEAPALLEAALACPNLKVDGLMTIAPVSDDPEVALRTFASLRECRDALGERFGVDLPELSMGMSGDMEEAIAEGSTMVRVGTALYGQRNYAG